MSPDPNKTSPFKSPNVSTWTEWKSKYQQHQRYCSIPLVTALGLLVNGFNGLISIDFDKINSYEPISDILEFLAVIRPTIHGCPSRAQEKDICLFTHRPANRLRKSRKEHVRVLPMKKIWFDHFEFRIKECLITILPSFYVK